MLYFGNGVSVRCGTHTGFVGEQAAGNAELHGFGNRQTECAAHNCLRIKCSHKDQTERIAKFSGVTSNDVGAADDVNGGHEGNDFLSHRRQTGDAAEENRTGEYGCHNTGDDQRNAESRVHGVGNRIGLHHVADATQSNDDGDREEDGHRTPFFTHTLGDVVRRTADHVAVGVFAFEGLSQHRFGKDGGHTEEGGNPQPEQGAGAARDDSSGRTRNVTGTHLSSDGGSQSLE